MRFILPRICALVAAAVCCLPAARAADPQTYRVELAPTGNKAMDATLRDTSDLITLRKSAPVSPFGLIARARGENDRLKTVLESYGYYQSRVTIRIGGMALNDPGLADALTALPKKQDARVAVSFVLGPLYHLRRISIEGALPASVEGALALKTGAPAIAGNVLAAGARLLAALDEQGYALAKVDAPIAYEDQTDPVLDVVFHVTVGPRVNIGDIRLEGLHRLHEKAVRRRLTLHTGEQYNSVAVERARKELLGLGVFASINVQVGTAVDAAGGVPITFQFRERPRHAVSINAAYSSDLGGSAGVTWSDRDVFGNAEQLNVSANLINAGGSASTGLGYDTSVKLIFPDFGHRDQSLQFAVGAVKQSLEAYDQTAVTTGVTLTRKLSKQWTVSAGVTTANEQIMQEGIAQDYAMVGVRATHDYVLVGLPLSVSYDSTNLNSPLDDPLHGMRDSLSVTPTRSLGQTSASFIISQAKFATYVDLEPLLGTDPGRSVLAARVLAGLAQGAGEFSLPPDQRFYGGGSGTIRGYRYQAVGPQFADGYPIGGTSIVAGSVEFRQRFGQNLGAAIFVDAGQVSSGLRLFGGACSSQIVSGLPPPVPTTPVVSSTLGCGLYVGVGAGIRYYTAIGPIRLDFALPTKRYSTDDDAFEIYIGLGQAF